MKEIQTNNTTILLVEVPEDAREFKIENGLLLFKADFIPFGIVILPSGQYQILGKSTELSEEQMKEICEECDRSKMNLRPYQSTPYKNYLSDGSSAFSGDDTWFKWNVQESYLSLLEANGVVDRNPHGDNCPPDVEPENDDDLGVISAIRYQKIGQWRVAQSKVKHYLVLKRI